MTVTTGVRVFLAFRDLSVLPEAPCFGELPRPQAEANVLGIASLIAQIYEMGGVPDCARPL